MKVIFKALYVFLFFLMSGFCYLEAGVVDDAVYLPDETDAALYINYNDIFAYLKSGEINPDEFMMIFGEAQSQQVEESLQKIGLKVSDIRDMIIAGNLSGIATQNAGFIIIVDTEGKGTIPREFLGSPVDTGYGTIYMFEGSGDPSGCFLKIDKYYIIGTVDTVKSFLKKRSMKPKDTPAFHKNFMKSVRGKTVYMSMNLSDVMKYVMDTAAASGAGSEMDKIRVNLFIRSMMAVKSLDASVEIGDGLLYNVGLYGVSGDDVDRLVMVSHCMIVNTSFLLTFADLITGRMNNPELEAVIGDREGLNTAQEVLARAKVKKEDDSVIITLNITKQESDRSLAATLKLIEAQKKLRTERLEVSRISDFTTALTSNDNDNDKAEKILATIPDVNRKDLNGDYPLAVAARYGNIKIIKLLMAKGADANLQSTNGDTALHFAVSAGMYDAVVILADKGADINARNNEGMTPLHMNSSQGDAKITLYLVKKGADVNSVAGDGYAPIHRAAESGNLEIIKVLAQNKADVELVNSDQERAIDIAARNGFDDIVNYFRDTFKQEPVEKTYDNEDYNEDYNNYDPNGDGDNYN